MADLPADDTLVLARTEDGRVMVWRASYLWTAMNDKTPQHLQFPAVQWMFLDEIPW